jgi:Superfamily I DNA and RNA helicases and helicase subunits
MSGNRGISCEFLHDPTVNFAMQQNHVPVIKRLRISNTSPDNVEQISVSITSEPEFLLPWTIDIARISPEQTIDLGTVDIHFSTSYLSSLTERNSGNLILTVTKDNDVLQKEYSAIDLLAFDEWPGAKSVPEIIAAFVTPNHPAITRILRKASEILQETTESVSLNGYQSKDIETVKKQLEAIYLAIQAQEIAYCVPPASFEETGQKIRTPDILWEHKLGTCLDLTILFAACAEAAGLNPLIIFIEGHSFPGVWLIDESFSESIQDDVTLLSKRVALGINEIIVFESTVVTGKERCSFDTAVKIGEEHLIDIDKFLFFVDIRRARIAQIRPLPIRLDMKIGDFEETNDGIVSGVSSQIAASTDGAESAILSDHSAIPRTRLEEWERRLLDLSLRNPLLNFRLTGASVPLLTAELGDLEDALADGLDFPILPRPSDWDGTPRDSNVYRKRTMNNPMMQLLREEFNAGRLRADLSEKELSTRLTQIYRSARTSLEENGANTLYLALGFLVWYESEASQKPRYAPILLIPMEIVRKSIQLGYIVREGEDEPQLNITLLEMLRQDFGIEISGLNPLPKDQHGVDVKKIFSKIRRAIIAKSRWEISEVAYVGLFSFNKFVMWNDLRNRIEDLKQNKIVSSLISGYIQWKPDSNRPSAEQLDSRYNPQDVFSPISADSSQLTAICLAGEGKSIVLHGPPGTGKSQTITNIISNVLAQGKTVLFVAEKMAALSVVQRRLSQIGLAPFCLEVHSNKSKKKEVLEQLRNALEINRISNSEKWQQEANRLSILRKELNAYVEALHKPRYIGHSIFYGLSRLAAIRWSPPVVKFGAEQFQSLGPEKLSKWADMARQLCVAGQNCGHPYHHDWEDAQRQDYSPQLRTQVVNALTNLRQSIEECKRKVPELIKLFSLEYTSLSYSEITSLRELTSMFLDIPTVPGTILQVGEWEETQKAIEEWIAHGRIRDELRVEIFAQFDERVMKLDATKMQEDLAAANEKWFLPRFLGRRRIIKAINSVLRPGTKLDNDDIEDTLKKIRRLHEEDEILSSAGDNAHILLGQLWQDGNADWEKVAVACSWAGSIRKASLAIAGTNLAFLESLRNNWAALINDYREQLSNIGPLGHQLRDFIEALKTFDAAWQAFMQLVEIDEAEFINRNMSANWLELLLTKVNKWEENIESLRDWCSWIRIKKEAINIGLQPLVEPYEQGKLKYSEVEPSFTHGLYQAWAEYEISNDKVLSSFSRGLFEDKIRQFRQLDDVFSKLTIEEIYARLAAKIPGNYGDATQNSEMGILQRELQKQRNHMALRTLFNKIPNVLSRLKPCLLMSPISVAQYLDPSHPPFDLVIFDEASQVPTCDAVGAIARGREVFVVGDPKQLPPTNFFSSNYNIEDDDGLAIQDLESILDDCLAIRIPQEHLRWHYRSKHESLIAFSNYQYYNNSLYTFPSPDDLTSMVRLYQIDGVYDRGKSKQNRAEADAIVAEVVQRLRDPELSKLSIGVVTFSQVQQRLIEDMLDEQVRQDPELESFFSEDVTEPVFVKNLENVQGDERDVIMFSIGYGPDAQGRVSMNFGPLNKEGGWRRLNVAVSRARQEMLVFFDLAP